MQLEPARFEGLGFLGAAKVQANILHAQDDTTVFSYFKAENHSIRQITLFMFFD